MHATILRKEAWQIIDSGALVDLCFITADRRRGTGGKYIELKAACKVSEQKTAAETKPAHASAKSLTPKKELAKDPRHSVHKTFNIHVPNRPLLHVHKVHYRLMHKLDGKIIIS